MERLGGVNFSALDPKLIQGFSHLKCQLQTSNDLSEDRERIERESDFVDEVILKVGKRKNCTTVLKESVTDAYFLSMTNPTVCKQLKDLQTPEERVEFVAKYFTGVRIQPEILKRYEKNVETSRQLRDHGNALFSRGNFQDALHYYNLALLFAEMDTEAAGLAYANRSAVLVELGQFEDALADVDLSLRNKYPESKLDKLGQRKIRCQQFIKQKQDEYFAIDRHVRKGMESEMQEMENVRDDMMRVKKPNPFVPAAEEFVEIKFDEKLGRQLVVNRDVAPGTVLVVEDPFIFTLYGQSKWDTNHCHHCLKRIWRGIPCERCVFATYCNESCRMDGKKIHRYECICLPSFHYMYAVDQLLTAVRIILKVGPQELFRLFETQDPAYFNPKQPFGTETNSIYESKSYQAVLHLRTHSDKLHFMKLLSNAQHALIATSILVKETEFFRDIPAERKMEFQKFVAALMVHHIEAEAINAVAMREVSGLEDVSFAESYSGKVPCARLAQIPGCVKFREFAGALYPLFSLINHSCDPNVSYLNHTTNGTIVVMAQRALKKGEPLFITYKEDFTRTEMSVRRSHLERIYHFQCHCIACVLKWPPLYPVRNPDPMPKLCCPACSKKFFQYEKGSVEFRKCLLAAPSWKCGRCGKRYTVAKLELWMKTSSELSRRILQLFDSNRAGKAYELFPRLLDFLQHHTLPPNGHLYEIQGLFMTAVAIIFYYAEQRLKI